MWQLGLTSAERATYEQALGESHVQAIRVEILDHEERPLGEATQGVLDAGVTFDLLGEVTRAADVTIARGALQQIPGLDQLAFTRTPGLFLRVWQSTYVEPLRRWIEVPLFTGPVFGSQTQGDELQLSAQGKEILLQPPHLPVGGAGEFGTQFPKNLRVTDAIVRLLTGGGEHATGSIPTLPKQLGRPYSLGPEGSRWALARRLAAKLDRQIWFDGEGRARLTQLGAGGPVFTFTPQHLLTEPAVAFSLGELRNTIRIGYGKGAKEHLLHGLPGSQPTSGAAMKRRNGVPRLMVESLDDEDSKNAKDAEAQADRMLVTRQLAYNVSLDAVLIPHLEPGDTVAVNSGGQATPFVLGQASLGLSADGGMTVNYLRRLPRKTLLRGRRKR